MRQQCREPLAQLPPLGLALVEPSPQVLEHGIAAVPCWVREMSDEDAYMALALCNAQGELHPLEVGLHALGSGLSIRDYAKAQGRKPGSIQDRVEAAKVANTCRDIPTISLIDRWSHLAEIHAAPRWLWPALVAELVADEKQTIEISAPRWPRPRCCED
jgi:hypothetical protein